MIGNDVVDLNFARNESNWQRIGFLDKIFTKNEQLLLNNSGNKELAVWILWSRKEAAYKIWNRETRIRKYNPKQFECLDVDLKIGKVKFESNIYFTKTEITNDFVHSVSVLNLLDFDNIEVLESSIKTIKHDNIPYIINKNLEKKPISRSHHGKFEFVVSLRNS